MLKSWKNGFDDDGIGENLGPAGRCRRSDLHFVHGPSVMGLEGKMVEEMNYRRRGEGLRMDKTAGGLYAGDCGRRQEGLQTKDQ